MARNAKYAHIRESAKQRQAETKQRQAEAREKVRSKKLRTAHVIFWMFAWSFLIGVVGFTIGNMVVWGDVKERKSFEEMTREDIAAVEPNRKMQETCDLFLWPMIIGLAGGAISLAYMREV